MNNPGWHLQHHGRCREGIARHLCRLDAKWIEKYPSEVTQRDWARGGRSPGSWHTNCLDSGLKTTDHLHLFSTPGQKAFLWSFTTQCWAFNGKSTDNGLLKHVLPPPKGQKKATAPLIPKQSLQKPTYTSIVRCTAYLHPQSWNRSTFALSNRSRKKLLSSRLKFLTCFNNYKRTLTKKKRRTNFFLQPRVLSPGFSVGWHEPVQARPWALHAAALRSPQKTGEANNVSRENAYIGKIVTGCHRERPVGPFHASFLDDTNRHRHRSLKMTWRLKV